MACVGVVGDQLVVRLSPLEKLGALHGDVRVPLAAVRRARPTTMAFEELSGMLRAPGTGVPGVVALGTYRGRGGKAFAAVYRHRPAVVVDLDDSAYRRLVVSTADADRLSRRLTGSAA